MEFLKEIIGEDLYKQLNVALEGKNVELINKADGSYLPRAKFNEQNETIKTLTKQVAERDKQLKDIKSNVGDNEELKQQISKLQEDNKAAGDQYKKQILDIKTKYALKEMLKEAKNPDTVMPLIDMEKVVVKEKEDGTVELNGFTEQLATIKEENGFLFNAPSGGGNPPNPAGGGGNPKGATFQERYDAAKTISEKVSIKREAAEAGEMIGF